MLLSLLSASRNTLQTQFSFILRQKRKPKQKQIKMLFTETAGRGPYSRSRAQFFPIRTSQPVNNIYVLVMSLHVFWNTRQAHVFGVKAMGRYHWKLLLILSIFLTLVIPAPFNDKIKSQLSQKGINLMD